jgi:type VI secretion system secreted protein Hcp
MRRKLFALAGTFVVLLAAGTYAWARTSAANEISACVDKKGNVRIVGEGVACAKDENALNWNIQGPQGVIGAAGKDGRDGRDGLQGPQGVQGPPGPAASANPDAVNATMTATGQKQGAIAGDGANGVMVLIGLSHAIVSPRDAASGLPTGKRQHKPLVITKPIDKSSPKLMQALFTNENLTEVVITLLRNSQAVATIKLVNANVSERQQHGEYEQISFTYQKIEWTWKDGGITALDDWESPIA